MGAHRVVGISGRYSALGAILRPPLRTAHVMRAPAAALVIALGEDDGVRNYACPAAGQTGQRGQNAVLWAWPCTRNGDTAAHSEGTVGIGVLRLRGLTLAD